MTMTMINTMFTPVGVVGAVPIFLKVGQNGNYNRNAQVTVEMETNDEGIMVPTNPRTTQETPTFQFTPSREDAQSGALRFMRNLVTFSGSAKRLWSQIVKQSAYAAVTTGQEGFGAVADDANAIAVVNRGNTSIALTRVAYAGFSPATPDQFAIGLNGALAFSTNLIGSSVNVAYDYPVANATRLGDKMPNFSAVVTAVLNQRDGTKRLAQLRFSLAAVNLQESGQITSGDPAQISIVDLSGGCAPQWEYYAAQPTC